MRRIVRNWQVWGAILAGAAAVAAILISLVVLGARSDVPFTATPYSDVIRFEAEDVVSLEVRVFDLSGKELWSSGVVSGSVVDWDRTNTWGERLSYGAYLYSAKGWDSQGGLLLEKNGKMALLPGDKVQLQQAPLTPPESERASSEDTPIMLTPRAQVINDDLVVNGILYVNSILGNAGNLLLTPPTGGKLKYQTAGGGIKCEAQDKNPDVFKVYSGEQETTLFEVQAQAGGNILLTPTGRVGIGTTNPAGRVDIHNASDQPALRIEASSGTNLIEAYNTGSGSATGLIFRVERGTGAVRADGAFYGAGFHTGSADVAEHINVSEPVESGDVVEIDPANPKHFRKAQTAGSRLVGGVISTNPGVVLGSNADPVEGEGDPRPVLALAGRVPVKATMESGPIAVGDILIASSTPGYAMRCSDPAGAVGAVIAKALEPLEEGEGLIMAQVMLR